MNSRDRTPQHDHNVDDLDETNNDADRSDVEDDADLDPDDLRWDAFLADEDELDPQPEHGDFDWDE